MSLGPAVVAQLAATPAIVALVGSRVYPQYAREQDRTYPVIVYRVDQVNPVRDYSGPSKLEAADLRLAALGSTQAQARAVGEAIQTALDGQVGVTWGDVAVKLCNLKEDGIDDDVVTDPTTEQILAYVKELSFTVWYLRP